MTIIDLIPPQIYFFIPSYNKLLQPRFWVKHKCWLRSSYWKWWNIVFIVIKGLWWWYWMFGLNGVYWSNFPQHWLFREWFELWHGDFFILVSASVIPADAKSPIPDHSNSINYNLISLNIPFDAVKDTFPSRFCE